MYQILPDQTLLLREASLSSNFEAPQALREKLFITELIVEVKQRNNPETWLRSL